MKFSNSKLFGLFGAIAAAFTIGKSSSALADSYSANMSTSNKNTLTDQLIQKNVFQIDNQTNEIQIDNDALVESVREELIQKMQSSTLNQTQQERYQLLLNNLKPGNYQRFHDGAKDLQSMHFDKK